MSTGLSAEAAAARIGISARSLFYWQRQHPEFLQAIQEGRQKCLLYWEERGIAIANGEPGNLQMVTLALKNRSRAAHGWNNDALQVQHSHEVQKAELQFDASRLDEGERSTLRQLLLKASPDVDGDEE
jgi:transposase-like protein